MSSQFENQFDAIAIRLGAVPKNVGKMADARPVVIFAQQGAASAGLDRPTDSPENSGAEINAADQFSQARGPERGNRFGHISPHFAVSRVIFVLDRSGSMNDSVISGSVTAKLDYVKDRIERLRADYFPPDAKVALISFDDRLDRVQELGMAGQGAMERFREGVRLLHPRSGTDFSRPFEAVRDLIEADAIEAKRAGIPVDDEGLRPLVVFLTDGKDSYGTRAEATKLMREIRALNATCFIIGIGEDYAMERIVEIAGQAGAASWSHLPLEQRALDVFDVQIPALMAQMFDCEHYFQIDAVGEFQKLTAMTQAMRFADQDGKSIYPGYERAPVGILYEKHDNLQLTLTAGRRIHDPNPFRVDIPIVDAEDAIGRFEQLQLAREFNDRFLIMQAMLDRDVRALKEIISINPSLESVLGEAIRDMEQQIVDRVDHGTHSIHSGMSVTGNSMSQIFPLKSPQLPSGETLNNVGNTMQFNAIPPQPFSQGLAHDSEALHSGGIGPLSLAPESVAPLPRDIDPRRYDRAQPAHGVPCLNFVRPIAGGTAIGLGAPSSLPLPNLAHGGQYVLGRDPNNGSATPIVILQSSNVSRTHCIIYSEAGKIFIKDLKSTNGTEVNGVALVALAAHELHEGDVIALPGVTPITFARAR